MNKINAKDDPLAPEFQMPLKDVTALLIKHYKIKKGTYEASIRFAITVGGVSDQDNHIAPGVAVGVAAIGLIPSNEENPNSINASTLK